MTVNVTDLLTPPALAFSVYLPGAILPSTSESALEPAAPRALSRLTVEVLTQRVPLRGAGVLQRPLTRRPGTLRVTVRETLAAALSV